VETIDSGLLARTCGQQHDRHQPCLRFVSQRTQQLEAVDAGHHDVANDQIRTAASHGAERGITVRNRFDIIVRAQDSA
jgi:hypothetical protein